MCPSLQEFPLSALAGTVCRCGFPTTLFPLHEREDEQLCAQRCAGEEFESCGTTEFLLVYQTQVQGGHGMGALGGCYFIHPTGSCSVIAICHSLEITIYFNFPGNKSSLEQTLLITA